MNKAQRWIVVFGLNVVSVLLIFVFWRVSSGHDYSGSLLMWPPSQGPQSYGLRIRMGATGVLLGLILPIFFLSAAGFIAAARGAKFEIKRGVVLSVMGFSLIFLLALLAFDNTERSCTTYKNNGEWGTAQFGAGDETTTICHGRLG